MEISPISQNRFQRILAILNERERVNVLELSEALSVSPVTVRRDLDKLNRLGLLERIHGGAVASKRRPLEVPFEKKGQVSISEKQAIAQYAASLVRPGDTIFLNSGTTTQRVVQHLKGVPVRVVTNNSATAYMELDPAVELILIGGEYRSQSSSLVGDIALSNLSSIYCSHAFLGVNGVCPEKGLTSAVYQETSINRIMIDHTQERVVVLADSTKVGKVSTFFSAPVNAMHTLITDCHCPEHHVARFVETGVEVYRTP
jgi:DeoR family fructose operon transcriptional repressor